MEGPLQAAEGSAACSPLQREPTSPAAAAPPVLWAPESQASRTERTCLCGPSRDCGHGGGAHRLLKSLRTHTQIMLQ